MKKILLFLAGLFCAAMLSAEIKVISPLEGEWANKQMLVIDTSDGSDCFYSLNGSDPSLEGFAYDGPVLIDLTGNITVRITNLYHESKTINLKVTPEYPALEDERNFVYSFMETGVLNYLSGAEINIPATMRYTFETVPESFIAGKTLGYSEDCSLSRFIPCTVTNGKQFWHFFIRTNPKSSGSYSRRDLPFSIRNWDTVVFEDDSLLFKFDDEFWNLPKENRILDRSVNHVIYWQSLSYEPGNPVEFYELPARPELVRTVNPDKSITFSLKGDESYTMSHVAGDSSFYELFPDLCADTFEGDYINDSSKVAVYADSVYQGTMILSYEIDKRLPAFPVFTSTAQGFHSRGAVNLNVRTSGKSVLYVAVSEPYELTENTNLYEKNSPVFENVKADEFVECGKTKDLLLNAAGENPVFYKVRAYSRIGNTVSDVAEYSVIIDSYNFYFDEAGDSLVSDGTKEHPFTSFEQCLGKIREYRSVTMYIKGRIRLPAGKTEMFSNCEVIGLENAVLEFVPDSSLVVKNSSLQISNCLVTSSGNGGKRRASPVLIKLENSVLDIKDCQVSVSGEKNCTVIDSSSSIVRMKNSLFSLSASTYASLLSSAQTRVDIKSCKFGVVSDTAVVFSVRGSSFNLKDSQVRVTGTIGRVCELFDVKAVISGNNFSADLKRHTGNENPLYVDKSVRLTESDNYIQGF